MSKKKWIPEIMYEDDDNGMTSNIPFIMVPKEEIMPKLLFMFESRETGEYEPGNSGEKVPIFDMELHQYVNMNSLKEGLTPDVYDQVRLCLGLEPLKTAAVKGMEITDRIKEKFNS